MLIFAHRWGVAIWKVLILKGDYFRWATVGFILSYAQNFLYITPNGQGGIFCVASSSAISAIRVRKYCSLFILIYHRIYFLTEYIFYKK